VFTAPSRAPSSELPSFAAAVGDLLIDLPTPSLLLELSLAEAAMIEHDLSDTLSDTLNNPSRNHLLNGSLFVHTRIIDTSVRDAIVRRQGSGKSQEIGRVDASPNSITGSSDGSDNDVDGKEDRAYLAIGLANHLVGGYYWARGMGAGASLPAHGVFLRSSHDDDDDDDGPGELYWKKRGPGNDPTETTDQSSNSNDGKRSEWADFLVTGDTVQLVPTDATPVLGRSRLAVLYGVRRTGRPKGADPVVEKVWVRDGAGEWIVV